MKKKKKIYILVCGKFLDLNKNHSLESMPELSIIADVKFIYITEKKSVNIGMGEWDMMAQEISKRYKENSGFVVLHEVDNLLYSAAAIYFMLQNFFKPIIFTGAKDLCRSDKNEIKANVINAVQAATYEFGEVGLMYGNRLLKASSAEYQQDTTLNVFSAPNDAVLGRIDFSIRIFDKVLQKKKVNFKHPSSLNENIEIVTYSPLINLKDLAKRIKEKDGLIVNAVEYKSLSDDFLFFVQKTISDKPVVIWSKNIQSSLVSPTNMILVNNITWHFVIVKFMWALSVSKKFGKVKQLMEKNINGEIMQ